MKKIETAIDGVYIIESDCYGDNRGWFMETYNDDVFFLKMIPTGIQKIRDLTVSTEKDFKK